MANVLCKFKIMPESPDVDLGKLKEKCKKVFEKYGNIGDPEIEPVAFGLNALIFVLIYDEKKGSTEPIEQALEAVKGVNSAECIDVRRAVG